jgi:hypothetical protein
MGFDMLGGFREISKLQLVSEVTFLENTGAAEISRDPGVALLDISPFCLFMMHFHVFFPEV